jgi:AAA15 family ATPase/GTPase
MDEGIKRFEVKNFKKFKDLVVDNIGQINLITGDNNVGKTCLLEALTLKSDIKFNISFLKHFLGSRGFVFDESIKHNVSDLENNKKSNIIGLTQKDINVPIIVNYHKTNGTFEEFVIKNENIDVVNTENSEIKQFAKELGKYPEINSLSKNWILFYVNKELVYMVDVTSLYYRQFFETATYIPLITLNDFFREDLVRFYNEAISGLSEKSKFIETLNSVFTFDKIIDIQTKVLYGQDQLTVATELNSSFHSITQYGSGFIRLLRIVLEMSMSQNKRLMIDEIDTGIHFLKMKDVWAKIFVLAKQMNIQIFATTHNLDCIKAFLDASEKNDGIKQELRLIELEEFNSKTNLVVNKSTTYDYETFKFKVETDTNIRGGNVWR